MRILVATLRYPPYVAGGYEQLTFDAVEALRGRGHDVSVLCGRGARLQPSKELFPLLEPPLPEPGEEQNLFALSHHGSNRERLRLHFLRRSNQRATRRALAESGAELLLFFNLGLVSLAPVLAARRARVATLGYVSDPWPLNHWLEDWRANPASAAKRWRLRALERAWRAWRDHVDLGFLLVSSDFLRRRFAAAGIPERDMDLLRVPLPPAMEPDPPVEGPPARAAGEPLRVASLSMLWEGKGVHVLLEAAASAVRGGADLRLELAGEGQGAYRERLSALAAVPELAGRVRFHGLVDREGAAALLASCHVLAFPSIWGEPFPTATLEAMARALAVVATRAGGTPEQITDGVEGLLVPADDAGALAEALARLERDEPLRQACGRAGLARVRAEHGMQRFTSELERAAQRALQSGPL